MISSNRSLLFPSTPTITTMKILVIDDTEKHRTAALKLLSGHDVTAVESLAAAALELTKRDLFGKKSFTNPKGYDVVLTDLAMPYESEARSMGIKEEDGSGTPLPIGLGVAALALKAGVSKVAVVSAGGEDDAPGSNHHGHPFVSWATLYFYEIPGRLWLFSNNDCPRTEIDGVKVKDWKVVLEKMLS